MIANGYRLGSGYGAAAGWRRVTFVVLRRHPVAMGLSHSNGLRKTNTHRRKQGQKQYACGCHPFPRDSNHTFIFYWC